MKSHPRATAGAWSPAGRSWRKQEIQQSLLAQALPVLEPEVSDEGRQGGDLGVAGSGEEIRYLNRAVYCSPWSGCGVPGTQGPQGPSQSSCAHVSGCLHHRGPSRQTRGPTDPRRLTLSGRAKFTHHGP